MKKIIIAVALVATLSISLLANAGTSSELSTYTDKNGKERIDWKSADKNSLSGGKTADEAAKEGANALGNTVGAPLAK